MSISKEVIQQFLTACEKSDNIEIGRHSANHDTLAKTTVRESDGNTALHIVCENNNSFGLNLFLQHRDLDPLARNHAGLTALDLADDTLNLHFTVRPPVVPSTLFADLTKGVFTLTYDDLFVKREGHYRIVTLLSQKMNALKREGKAEEAEPYQAILNRIYVEVIRPHDDKNVYWMAATNQLSDLQNATMNLADPLPLNIACLCGHRDVVEFLITKNMKTSLYTAANACLSGDVKLVEKLIASDASVDFALHQMCSDPANLPMVEILVKAKGVNLNEDFRGFTPLMVASRAGNTEAVKTLLIAGAKIYDQFHTKKHGNVLHLACLSGNVDCVRALLAASNTPLNVKNPDGLSALELACQHGRYPAVVKTLLEQENIDIGKALLLTNNPEIATDLLKKDWPTKSEDVVKALLQACKDANEPLVQVLLDVTPQDKWADAFIKAYLSEAHSTKPDALQNIIALFFERGFKITRTELSSLLRATRHYETKECIRAPIRAVLRHDPEGAPPAVSGAKPLIDNPVDNPLPKFAVEAGKLPDLELVKAYSVALRQAQCLGDQEKAALCANTLKNIYHDIILPKSENDFYDSLLSWAVATGQLNEVWREWTEITESSSSDDMGKLAYTIMISACENGHLDVVNFLLSSVTPSASAFEAACRAGFLDIAQVLLSNADIIPRFELTNGKALRVAVMNNRPRVTGLVLEHCQEQPNDFEKLFIQACKMNFTQVVDVFLTQKKFPLPIHILDQALSEVCQSPCESSAVVSLLLQHGAGKNRVDVRRLLQKLKGDSPARTVLRQHLRQVIGKADVAEPLVAEIKPFPELMYKLFNRGLVYVQRYFNEVILPDAEDNNRHPHTPFYYAAALGFLDEVKKEYPTQPSPAELDEALNMACLYKQLEVVQYLLKEKGLRPNAQTLPIAAEAGHAKIVELLLAHNAPTAGALYRAAENRHFNVVECLLNAKVDPNDTVDGKTALWVACETCSPDAGSLFKNSRLIVEALLNNNAHVDCPDPEFGFTPVMLVCEHGDLEILTILLAKNPDLTLKAKPTARCDDHHTAMLIACRQGHHKLVHSLLLASPNAYKDSDKNAYSALAVAIRHNRTNAMEVLLKVDSDPTGIALVSACESGNITAVKRLVSRLDPNNPLPEHFGTAVRAAVERGKSHDPEMQNLKVLMSVPVMELSVGNQAEIDNALTELCYGVNNLSSHPEDNADILATRAECVELLLKHGAGSDLQKLLPALNCAREYLPIEQLLTPKLEEVEALVRTQLHAAMTRAELPPRQQEQPFAQHGPQPQQHEQPFPQQGPPAEQEGPPVHFNPKSSCVIKSAFITGTLSVSCGPKKFARGKLKEKLILFLVGKLTNHDVSHVQSEEDMEKVFYKTKFDISELKRDPALSKAQQALLVGKTHFSLEEALNFQRITPWSKKNTAIFMRFFPDAPPMETLKDRVIQFLKEQKMRLLSERVKLLEADNTEVKIRELHDLIGAIGKMDEEATLTDLCACRPENQDGDSKNLLATLLSHRDPEDTVELSSDLTATQFKAMKKPKTFRDFAKAFLKEVPIEKLLEIVKESAARDIVHELN